MVPNLNHSLVPVHCVKGVLEIKLEDDFVGVERMTLAPLADRVDSTIGAQRGADPDLARPEMPLYVLFGDRS